jgi:hypothetical protein
VSVVRRVLLVAAIAAIAVVPLRAFGIVGGGSDGLSVTASLGGCGVAGEGIVCRIDVSFTGVEDADHYTASVTRADGSVQDLGTVGSGEGGGSASVSVPYVGAGNYAVTVSAWGTPDDDDAEPELLDREDTKTSEKEHTGEASAEPATEAPEATTESGPAAEGEAEPAPAEPAPAEPAPQNLPQCRPDAAASEAAAPPEDDGEAPAAEAASATPPPAPIVECATPSSDSNGPCCPPGA